MCKSRTAKWAGVRAIAPVEVVEEALLLLRLSWDLVIELVRPERHDVGLDATRAERDEAIETEHKQYLALELRVRADAQQRCSEAVKRREDGHCLEAPEVGIGDVAA